MTHLDGATLDTLWDFSDAAASEARLRAQMSASSGAVRDELRAQVARALGLQSKFVEGHTELDAIASDDAVVLQRIALERGRLFNSASQSAQAQPQFAEALRIDADPYLTVDALHMLALVDATNPAWFEQAMAIVDGSTDPRVQRWRGSLLNNHAWSLADAGDEGEALAEFERAEAWFREHGTESQIHVARWSVAHLLRRNNRIEEAREILEDLRANDPADPYVEEELALLD